MSENRQSEFYGQQAREHDDVYDTKKVSLFEYDPSGNLKRTVVKNLAVKIAVTGLITYIGKASIGSATSATAWQIKKIDEASGVSITWADGNDNFDNVWDNHSSLTYL